MMTQIPNLASCSA